ncbi:8813_t:CDS:2, partial [Funneliformis mosseae]
LPYCEYYFLDAKGLTLIENHNFEYCSFIHQFKNLVNNQKYRIDPAHLDKIKYRKHGQNRRQRILAMKPDAEGRSYLGLSMLILFCNVEKYLIEKYIIQSEESRDATRYRKEEEIILGLI